MPRLAHRSLLAAATALAAPPVLAQTPLLPDTVVSASREPQPASRVGSAVSVISREELEARQIRTVADALRDVPGVAVSRTGAASGVTELRLRGMNNNHTLVLVDGVKMNFTADFNGAFDLTQFLAQDIERIEILRGPQSSLYGSEAIGGVINIVTRRAAPGFSASAFGEYGSFKTWNAGASASFANDMLSAIVSVGRLETHGISSADARNGNAEADRFRLSTARARFTFTPAPWLEFTLFGRIAKSRGDNDAFTFVVPPGQNFQIAVDDRSNYDYEQRVGRAEAAIKLFDNRWITRLGVQHVRAMRASAGDPGNIFSGDFYSLNRSDKTKFDVQSTVTFDTTFLADAEHRLILYYENERERFQNHAYANFFGFVTNTVLDRTNVTNALVGEYGLTLWERLSLSGAIRFERNSFFESHTTYRLAAAYLHKETGTRLHASRGTGVRNPSFFELFGFAPPFAGNPALTPERATGWDIGVEQKFWRDRIVVDLTYFNQRFRNAITGTAVTAINLPGETRAQGLELSAKVLAAPGLTLGGSYTLTESRDPDGHRSVRRARHIGSVFATYVFLDGRATLHANARFNGPQRDIVFDAAFNRGAVDLPGYVLINVAGSFKLHESVELYGRIENALNARYQQVFSYGNPGLGAFAGLRVKLEYKP